MACDVQKDYLHFSDAVFEKEKRLRFLPIRDENVRLISLQESRGVLEELGIMGELLHTPGHSDDSISLWLDQGALFVGDLNPLYELELHAGTEIEKSWNRLLALKPRTIYYGHAKTALLETEEKTEGGELSGESDGDSGESDDEAYGKWYDLVADIMRYIDKGYRLEKIVRKTGAAPEFVEDVARMYLTHSNVGVRGILDRLEIRNR